MRYNEKHRAYHNLQHIAFMLELAEKHRDNLQDFQAVLLSIWFHDAIYEPLRKDNEEQSAALATTALRQLAIDRVVIDKITHYILATKQHLPTQENDLQWFLDFDLAILSSSPEIYEAYTQQIRQEYSFYPDFIYRVARKKVMTAFLERPAIYGKLGDHAEQQARLNITLEISQL